jgi:hypothetical protein
MENSHKEQFNPGLVVDFLNQEEDLKEWLKQKRKLPRNIRYGLLSAETEELVKQICEKYKLETPAKVGSVSILVRDYLAGQLNEESLKKELYRRLQFSNSISLEFLKDFKNLVEKVKQIGLKEVKKDLVVLKFNDLLEKIPIVKKQEIGIYSIQLPQEAEKREPTIENWITDYKLRKNDQQETTILNVSDYLYNNKNTQELDLEEKNQLSTILKAYEENQIIYYNKLFEEIDFEIIELINRNKKQKKNYNITSLNSKPYHDTDQIKKEGFSERKQPFNSKDSNQKVLNLTKYI